MWKERAYFSSLGSRELYPAKALHADIYLAAIIQTASLLSPLTKAFYSLKWVHNTRNQVSTTDSNLVKIFKVRIRLSKMICKKEHTARKFSESH